MFDSMTGGHQGLGGGILSGRNILAAVVIAAVIVVVVFLI
jgi:hypothetical protein